jgi:RNA polymerase sigma-70 factor (ECF subfamily)
MADDDRELLQRIQQGDAESFGALYDRTRGWLLTFVITPRVGRTDAEDVLAETYRVALDKIHSFRWQGIGLLHWLAAIARRKAQEHRRRQGGRHEAFEDVGTLVDLPDDTPTVETEMIRLAHQRELRDRVGRTLAALPPRYARALQLRILEDRSRAFCAEQLGVSVATFDVVLYRATRAFSHTWSTP